MPKKTNKTSHVMDLLTNGASSETQDTGAAAQSDAVADSAEKKGDVQSHTVSPSKVTVVDEGSINDRVSQEILNKLSEELQEDLAQGAPAQEEPVPQSEAPAAAQTETAGQPESPAAAEPEVSQAAAEPASQAAEDTAGPASQAAEDTSEDTQTEPSQEPENGDSQAAPVPIVPKSQLGNTLQTGEYHFVNVMEQLLLRQDINDFIKQYNVCPCQRCVTDVCALTLTGMPSKYVVVNKDSVSPLLSYYESRYKIYMLTELIKACNKVRESPRHKR